jgi:hypothetical protein
MDVHKSAQLTPTVESGLYGTSSKPRWSHRARRLVAISSRQFSLRAMVVTYSLPAAGALTTPLSGKLWLSILYARQALYAAVTAAGLMHCAARSGWSR